MKRILACAGIFVLVCAGFAGWLKTLDAELDAEKLKLKAAITERDAWRSKAREAAERSEALADNARRCLAREAKAQADAAERMAIMENVRPKQRTEAEKAKVVDDDTRRRVINRLNSGL